MTQQRTHDTREASRQWSVHWLSSDRRPTVATKRERGRRRSKDGGSGAAAEQRRSTAVAHLTLGARDAHPALGRGAVPVMSKRKAAAGGAGDAGGGGGKRNKGLWRKQAGLGSRARQQLNINDGLRGVLFTCHTHRARAAAGEAFELLRHVLAELGSGAGDGAKDGKADDDGACVRACARGVCVSHLPPPPRIVSFPADVIVAANRRVRRGARDAADRA